MLGAIIGLIILAIAWWLFSIYFDYQVYRKQKKLREVREKVTGKRKKPKQKNIQWRYY